MTRLVMSSDFRKARKNIEFLSMVYADNNFNRCLVRKIISLLEVKIFPKANDHLYEACIEQRS